MPRITKDPQIRMAEILDVTERLFNVMGYQATQVSDIVKSIGVSQGTFYYYFKSKEEVLEALIRRQVTIIISEIEMVANANTERSFRKIELVLYKSIKSFQSRDGLLFEYLCSDRYLYILDRIGRLVKELLTPLLIKIVKEGIRQGYFKAIYPKETVDFVLAIIGNLIESLYKKESAEKLAHRLEIARNLILCVLDVQPVSI